MRLEAIHRTGACVATDWGAEPNLRAEIKQKLAQEIAMQMRTRDLIDYVVTTDANGDTLITASVLVERTGDEK
jgi:hypothetical protein